MRVNDRFGARQFLYSDHAGGHPVIKSVPEEICDVGQDAGLRPQNRAADSGGMAW